MKNAINKLKPVFVCFLLMFCAIGMFSGSNVRRASAENITLHTWVSETPMGDVPDRFFQSKWVYLCYELLDSSGNRIGNNYNNYQVMMYQYSPTYEMINQSTYNNSNNNWIAVKNNATGLFTGRVCVTGSIVVDGKVEWYQNDKTPKLSLSQSKLSLHTQNAKSATVTCTVGGDVFDYTYHLSVANSNTSVVSTSWGGWYNNDEKCDLKITAKSAGSSTLTVKFVKSDGTVFDSQTISVKVSEPVKNTYMISYDANGGLNAPSSQTKTEGVDLRLSTYIPSKSYTLSYTTGYNANVSSRKKACTFNSWNTSPTGIGTMYMPGALYTRNSAATLYAMWSNPKMESDDLPVLTREGYNFLGWYTASDGGTKITTNTVITSNMSLYAHWSLNAIPVPTNTPKPTAVATPRPTNTPKPTAVATPRPTNTPKPTATATPKLTSSPKPTISAQRKNFVWNKDNWNFNNNSLYFPSGKMVEQIDSTYLNKLESNLTNSEYRVLFDKDRGWLYNRWSGSCYGMSSTTLLAMENFLPYSNYKAGATNLYQLNYPLADSKVRSLLTYYQLLQVKSVIQQQYRTVPNKSHKENISNIISLLDQNNTVLVGYQKTGWGGHAVLAYGYEYGSYTWDGVSYQGCIKICDPNSSKEYNKECNIYFNTNSYNWTIPYYSRVPITSASGAEFNYVGANVNEINCGGYLPGTTKADISNFVARIDAVAVADNRSVMKVKEVNGNYITQNNAPGDIIEDYSYVLGGESEGMIGYNLYDAQSAYQLSQNSAERLQLSIDYEDCYLEGGSAAGNKIVFDKDGYVSVFGESADYNIAMTYNDKYPTDWFTIQITGENSDEVSLEKEDNGYILSGDNLENIEVTVNNREDSAYTEFTTEYPSAYIYEIDEETIGVKVDTDNNGTYETLLDTGHTHEYNSRWESDAENHWKECKCGEKLEVNAHEFQWIIDQDATVLQSGLKHEECTVCAYKRNENTVINKLPEEHAHDYNSEWQSNSNGHWKNCNCGQKSEIIAHTFIWVIDKVATLMETGLKHEECNVCEYIRNKNTVIEKLFSEGDGLSAPLPGTVNEPTASPKASPTVSTDAGEKSPLSRGVIRSLTNKKGRRLVVKIKPQKNCSGYQLQCSRYRNMKRSRKLTVRGTAITIKGLKKRKVYYVRVRAYTVVDGTRKYGAWSAVRRKKIKK